MRPGQIPLFILLFFALPLCAQKTKPTKPLYGYAILGAWGRGIVSYPNFSKTRVGEMTGYAGVGFKLQKNIGIGLGISGLATVLPAYQLSSRGLWGAGLQGMFSYDPLCAMLEIGYASLVEYSYSDEYIGYRFSPYSNKVMYYRVSGGIRVWKSLLLMANILGTPLVKGWESAEFIGEDGRIETRMAEVRKAIFSWQLGVGFLIGKS